MIHNARLIIISGVDTTRAIDNRAGVLLTLKTSILTTPMYGEAINYCISSHSIMI